METNSHTLPPRKRLGLRQRLRQDASYTLPTKKRSHSRRPTMSAVPESITYPLPTKKRVWAFQPESVSIRQTRTDPQVKSVDYLIRGEYGDGGVYSLPAKKRRDSRFVGGRADTVSVHNRKRVCAFKPDFLFDLNVEYKPSFGDDCKLESEFGNVEIESIELKKGLQMNVGYGFDDNIDIVNASSGYNCADMKIIGEFGAGVAVNERKRREVIHGLGREEKRLVEGIRFESVSNFDYVEIDEKETSVVVEEMGNADGINLCEVDICEEDKDSEYVDGCNGGVDGRGYDGEWDSGVKSATGSNGGKKLGNPDVLNEDGVNICVEDTIERVDIDIVQGCCNEAERDVYVESAVDGGGEELGNADVSNEAGVNICDEESIECEGLNVANKVNGVVEGCGNEVEIDACVDGNGELENAATPTLVKLRGVVECCCPEAESDSCVEGETDGNGDFDNTLTPPNIQSATEADSESEDGVFCKICQSTDGDPSDPIVFCDGCDIMVHASCYGNPLIKGIPEGDWFCDKCIFQAKKPSKTSSCCLCPSPGGVLKATNDGRWAHIVCTVFVPEAFFLDPEGRQGIDVSKIFAKRWRKKCYVCEKMKGCVIGCSESKCCLSFHVTCGLKEDLCIEYREGNMKKGAIVAGFCKDHTKLWKKQQRTGKFKIVARKSDET